MTRADRVEIHHARTDVLDVAVSLDGERFHVLDVGIGHPPHTITRDGGRCSTDVEIALAEALAAAMRPPALGDPRELSA